MKLRNTVDRLVILLASVAFMSGLLSAVGFAQTPAVRSCLMSRR